jgi:hypothetical protein
VGSQCRYMIHSATKRELCTSLVIGQALSLTLTLASEQESLQTRR